MIFNFFRWAKVAVVALAFIVDALMGVKLEGLGRPEDIWIILSTFALLLIFSLICQGYIDNGQLDDVVFVKIFGVKPTQVTDDYNQVLGVLRELYLRHNQKQVKEQDFMIAGRRFRRLIQHISCWIAQKQLKVATLVAGGYGYNYSYSRISDMTIMMPVLLWHNKGLWRLLFPKLTMK